jgi:hypothetical protein
LANPLDGIDKQTQMAARASKIFIEQALRNLPGVALRAGLSDCRHGRWSATRSKSGDGLREAPSNRHDPLLHSRSRNRFRPVEAPESRFQGAFLDQ